MSYDFDREQAIEESLEHQGFRPMPGKAKQGGPCRQCGEPTENLSRIHARAEYLCADCSAAIRRGENPMPNPWTADGWTGKR
jgi:hypothetical protein